MLTNCLLVVAGTVTVMVSFCEMLSGDCFMNLVVATPVDDDDVSVVAAPAPADFDLSSAAAAAAAATAALNE